VEYKLGTCETVDFASLSKINSLSVVEAAGVVPASRAAGVTSAPNYDADTKAERSEELVEAAGVEPASENTSSKTSYVRVPILDVATG
jgi:hypothetical protein